MGDDDDATIDASGGDDDSSDPMGGDGFDAGDAGDDTGAADSASALDAGGADPQGTKWHFFCPGHFASYREGKEVWDHGNEYGPNRSVKYLAEQDQASHVSQWPQHAGIAVVEEA
jgi:hypothetical protein